MTMPLVVYALSRSELGIDMGMNGHRAFLDGFFNSLPFMIGLIEIAADDIRHVAANNAAARFFRTTPEAIPQQWFSQLGMSRGTIRQWLMHCHTARRTGAPIQFDYAHAVGGDQRWFSATVSTIAAPSGPPFQLSYLIQEITDRKQREYRLEALTTLSTALRAASTRAEMLPILLDQVLVLLDVEGALLTTTHPSGNETVIALGRGCWASATGQRLPPNQDLGRQTLTNGQLYLNNHLRANPTRPVPDWLGPVGAIACVPLRLQDEAFGALWVGRLNPVTSNEMQLLSAIADLAASAIQRSTLHEQTERRLRNLQALRAIDTAITTSHDLQITLGVLLEQVIGQLNAHAADVLLINPRTGTLDYAAGRGFRAEAHLRAHLRLNGSYAGQAALEQRFVHIPNLMEAAEDEACARWLRAEGFVAYHGVPLLVKGQVRGVLEIFHRAPLELGPEWLDFLSMLAGQAAIAVDNATLFENLLDTNAQLREAYDATIQGWSRALDLRDRETEGHTQRVTQTTLRLARAMGVDEAELVHIYRGALLHDIGKMGIPDNILHKRGPLTEDEWAIMRQHPTYAFEMLAPIAYLRPALDIPYCHHEKWDGTGYPRGLKDDQIPLAARIFAIADVWDALCSNRPYRSRWPEGRVRDHLRAQAGKHFDPRVMEVFLKLLDEETTLGEP